MSNPECETTNEHLKIDVATRAVLVSRSGQYIEHSGGYIQVDARDAAAVAAAIEADPQYSDVYAFFFCDQASTCATIDGAAVVLTSDTFNCSEMQYITDRRR